ncbi:two component transcriptional regulator, AraC family [Caldicellulosiruptor hydrothermalis 108]|uniref:Two component transcriptional regulator, AraC family n=1 Tax=Caldicellulosiruptor hydrothermalis (strain DSM 18901 / VKM B-2411 / 108) TaxID=632292 RepID=E4Q9Y9_CALH1|nr:helix-turn-helix domain-containing protein [Caldicellulosiruptor hydrothermalis]ADQ05864.1 two component transcriptional regulator, AraC family [Caldicellulosiruptor hydrothermalis 108]
MTYKILIADDEKIVVDSIKFILENNLKEDIEISTFTSGREALENLLFYSYHIAFIDIKMPDLDGLELIEEFRKMRNSDFPLFIIVSAYDKFEFAKKAIKEKAFAYILKPYSIEDIISTVQSAIAHVNSILAKTKENIEKNAQLIVMRNLLENSFIPTLIFKNAFDIVDVNQYEKIFGINLKSGFLMVLAPKDKSDFVSSFKELDNIRKDIRISFEHKALISIGMGEYLICFFPASSQKEAEVLKEKVQEILKQKPYWNDIKIGFSDFYYLDEGYENAFWEAYYSTLDLDSPEENEENEHLLLLTENLEAKLIHSINNPTQIPMIENYINQLCRLYIELFGENNLKYKVIKLIIMLLLEIGVANSDESIDVEKLIAQILNASSEQIVEIFKKAVLTLFSKAKIKHEQIINNDSINKAIEFINQNYNQEITLSQISAAFNFNPYYFSKLFKKYTGVSFKTYLTKLRIQKACQLLKNSSKSIKEISFAVGFSDPNYFIKAFKKFIGVTPSAYRNLPSEANPI